MKKIKLNIFTNSSSHPELFEILMKTYKSAIATFGEMPVTVWHDPHPNIARADEYHAQLCEAFEDVRVTRGLADGYLQSLDTEAEYLFQLEHDWIFNDSITHTLAQILEAMDAEKICYMRFNMRQNIVQLGDKTLAEFDFCGVPMLETPGFSNNPHIINRKLFRKHYKRFLNCWGGPHGIEECIDKARVKSKRYIYGFHGMKAAITHLDGRESEPKIKPNVKALPKDPGFFVWNFMPYAPKHIDLNMGAVNNKYMQMLGPDDWAIFIDHDAFVTTKEWYLQICDIIVEHGKEYGMFTAMTNRWRHGEAGKHIYSEMAENYNYVDNCNFGQEKADELYSEVERWTWDFAHVAGHFFVISQKAWQKIGGFKEGFFGVDTHLFESVQNLGGGVGLMKGVYVFHGYRLIGNGEHVKRAHVLHKNAVERSDPQPQKIINDNLPRPPRAIRWKMRSAQGPELDALISAWGRPVVERWRG